MGIKDRDYYREDYAKKNGMSYDWKSAVYSPKLFRRRSGPPDTPGTSWHWVKQLVVWVAFLAVVFLGFKFLEQRKYVSLLEKQMAEQHRLIQQQKRQIEVLTPKPSVDFFK